MIPGSKLLELTYYHKTWSEEFNEYYDNPYFIEYKWLYFPGEAECEIMCISYEDENGNFSLISGEQFTDDKYLDKCIDTYMYENAEWVSQYE